MPYPLPLTRTEAYLAYKAGVVQLSDLKPSLAVPRNGIDAWLAYWTGLAEDYPKREDGTPHILQEEEAYIAYLCGVINEYPEKCLRRVGAYLRYLISARWGRPDHPLNREELYLSLIKTQFIPSGDPSSDIVINGTTKAPFVDVKMYGDTFQQSYTGKNLFNFRTANIRNGYLFDNLLKYQQNYPDRSFIFKCSPSTTYTISRSIITSSFRAAYTDTAVEDIPATLTTLQLVSCSGQINNNSGSSITITTGSNAQTLIVHYGHAGNDAGIIQASLESIQIEVGSTATTYEPYVGGVPSPNPSYPQAIQTVTGVQTVSINGTDYPLDLGSIELCKLGTYQDYIWKDGEDWKIRQNYIKITGLGDNSWIWDATIPRFSKNGAGLGIDGVNVDTVWDAVSNKFIAGSFDQVYTNKTNGMAYSSSGFISVVDTSWTDVTTARDSLSGGVIYCRLRIPTDTTITDQALIAQLEALKQGGAEEGTTYIKVNATNPNLPGLLYVEAPKYD